MDAVRVDENSEMDSSVGSTPRRQPSVIVRHAWWAFLVIGIPFLIYNIEEKRSLQGAPNAMSVSIVLVACGIAGGLQLLIARRRGPEPISH
jgi:hypothetical protein